MSVSVSIIIPTFNRLKELVLTLPQIIELLDDDRELIVFDQSNTDQDEALEKSVLGMMQGPNCRFIRASVPSVPLAWNTAARLAKGEVLIFLDDDIDVDHDVIAAHLNHYKKDPKISGVAGGYYASNRQSPWVSSKDKKGYAKAMAGVNFSLRKKDFLEIGAASSFVKPFAGIDWELGEQLSIKVGPLAVGSDCMVLHRAPADGGCGNQGFRGEDWYEGAYHNHLLWMFGRSFPEIILRLPRHIYWMYRYYTPTADRFFTKKFFKTAILAGIRGARRTNQNKRVKRPSEFLNEEQYKDLA